MKTEDVGDTGFVVGLLLASEKPLSRPPNRATLLFNI